MVTVIANQTSGVGKTTSAANIGQCSLPAASKSCWSTSTRSTPSRAS
jgi:septum formation inhibitor-activating ATPase MinD